MDLYRDLPEFLFSAPCADGARSIAPTLLVSCREFGLALCSRVWVGRGGSPRSVAKHWTTVHPSSITVVAPKDANWPRWSANRRDGGRIGLSVEFACTNHLVNIETEQLDRR
jgi:hypothetical protein